MRKHIYKFVLLLFLAKLVSLPASAQVCMNNHLTNADFASGMASWAQYGATNGVILPINSGCITTCLALPATNNSNSGVAQQVVIHKDTCYDLCYCIESPNNGGNTRVVLAFTNGSVTVAQLLSGSFSPAQAQILDNYYITSSFSAYMRCPGTVKASGNFSNFVIVNETIGNIGSDIRFDNLCVQTRLPCPANPCDSLQPSFSYAATGTTVQFTDQTATAVTNPVTSWSWDFGDPPSGANNTSTLQNPVHVFTAPGWYLVCLYVTAANTGVLCQDTICMDVFVPAGTPCDSLIANFSYTTSGLTANFTDNTTVGGGLVVTGWSWDFGDPPSGANNTSNLQNPAHTFTAPGWYLVCFTVSAALSDGTVCHDTICKDVYIQGSVDPCDSLMADFAYSTSGLTASFADISTVGGGLVLTGWSWDFGDPSSGANNFSNLQNPSHTFTGPGWYLVCLAISASLSDGTACYDTICKDVYVSQSTSYPCDSLQAWFTSGGNMLMNFNDLTTAGGGLIITGWSWDFGDPPSGVNNFSTLQNPSHQYSAPGIYYVCLAVSGYIPGTTFKCYDTICREVTVTQGTADAIKPDSYNVLISPNPTSGKFRIDAPGVEIRSLQIFDNMGNKVQEFSTAANGEYELRKGLGSGIYMVRIITDSKVIIKQLVFLSN